MKEKFHDQRIVDILEMDITPREKAKKIYTLPPLERTLSKGDGYDLESTETSEEMKAAFAANTEVRNELRMIDLKNFGTQPAEYEPIGITPQRIEVPQDEILFFIENQPVGFPRIIVDHLQAKGIKTNRVKVHNELTKIKKTYNREIIEAARFLLKAVKGLEYSSK